MTDINIGFLDSATNLNGGSSVLNSGSPMANPAGFASVASYGLKAFGEMRASKAQINNIFTNIRRTELNIAQIEEQMLDSLDIQVRKMSRRGGTQMAKIGASGVGFSGSPLMVMAETHRRGVEDYEAIEKTGRFAIDNAYLSIFDQLDQAKDIAKSQKYAAASNAIGMGSSAFSAGLL